MLYLTLQWHGFGTINNMKKQILFIALLVACMVGYNAQAQVSVRFNIGVQPVWGPVGYDYVDYYYIPDIDAYYDVNHRQYVYFEDGRWITSGGLPPRYHDFDIYHAHKVVINEPSPWLNHERYRNQYSQYRGRHDQVIIRDSHEDRYRENPNHPEHGQWQGNHGHEEHGRGREGHGHEDHGHEDHGHGR